MPDSESNQPKFTERLSEAFKMLLALCTFIHLNSGLK